MTASIDMICGRFQEYGDKPAIFWHGKEYSYRDLRNRIGAWEERLEELCAQGGDKKKVCGILGEFSPEVIALFFALMKQGYIIVPFTRDMGNVEELKGIANVECMISFDGTDQWEFEAYEPGERSQLLQKQMDEGRPGLVVFSSGSTGKPKGILQDCERVMGKFVKPQKGWRTVLFLMMDHFGGFNTLLGALANGGTAVCLDGRTPDVVARTIESAGAELLPTTPTFLNLLIASRCYRKYDLSSLELITYGTEMMNQTTLQKLQEIFPKVRLKQTYGLSELGVLRSKSKEDGSLWLKVGGSEFRTKVVDNILWIKADSNMVGYLNAPNPFDEDGWFCTGDEVEQEGDYIHFVGRKSEIINVGGQKVFPAEVEAVILEDDNVDEVTVFGRSHPLMGQIVTARITLHREEPLKEVSMRIKKRCSEKLARYKIPVKIERMAAEDQVNERFKKIRRG